MTEAVKTAVVTGASSGIGEATARALAAAGYRVIVGARRLDRLRALAAEIDGTTGRARGRAIAPGKAGPERNAEAARTPATAGTARAVALELDVTDAASVEAFVAQVPQADLLVNNAGGALGLEPIAAAKDDDWRTMWEANVLGVMRMTRALLPALLASGDGHVVNMGSIAAFENYPGGAGYTSVKHAVRALTRTLRLELLGQPVRVTEIDPGMVETEFSVVRFHGDEERARSVYSGLQPLTAEDVADCVVWAVTRPSHVNIDEIVVRPRDQATAHHVHRRTPQH
jgi:NADP-dependent 3-hydroxy acid dehydrogenase YdfG